MKNTMNKLYDIYVIKTPRDNHEHRVVMAAALSRLSEAKLKALYSCDQNKMITDFESFILETKIAAGRKICKEIREREGL
jgi:hypothetical protein